MCRYHGPEKEDQNTRYRPGKIRLPLDSLHDVTFFVPISRLTEAVEKRGWMGMALYKSIQIK